MPLDIKRDFVEPFRRMLEDPYPPLASPSDPLLKKRQPESLRGAFDMQAEANRSATKFYADTWHDSYENAIKCPVCKPKAVAYQEAERLRAVNKYMLGAMRTYGRW
jgi:hypothetical protein